MKICIVSDCHDRANSLLAAVAKAQAARAQAVSTAAPSPSRIRISRRNSYGGNVKQAGLDGHIIQPKNFQEIAGK